MIKHTIEIAADLFHGNTEVLSSDNFFEVNFKILVDGDWREGMEYEIDIMSIYLNTGDVDHKKRPVMIALPQLKEWIQPFLQKHILEGDLLHDYIELETV